MPFTIATGERVYHYLNCNLLLHADISQRDFSTQEQIGKVQTTFTESAFGAVVEAGAGAADAITGAGAGAGAGVGVAGSVTVSDLD